MKIRWKKYKDGYLVSDKGEVMSLKRKSAKILKQPVGTH